MKIYQLMTVLLLPMISGAMVYGHGTSGKESAHKSAGHCPSHHKSGKTQPVIKMEVLQVEDAGDKKKVRIRLSDLKDGSTVSPANLKEVHTEKVHLLIIDDALEDYSHIHPTPSPDTPGMYEFTWQPKTTHNYRIWADLHPLLTDAQEYAIADLKTDAPQAATINRATVMESKVGDYTFKISFCHDTLRVNQAVTGTAVITDAQGNPVKTLEPLMGAFAHIVGFSDDLQTVIHVHPEGKEPQTPDERGGPELKFHILPEKTGFIRLYVQVKINGKEYFAPFGLNVTD